MSKHNNASTKTGGLSLTAKRWIYIGIAFAIMILIRSVTFPASLIIVNGAELTAEGQNALAVLAFALLLWITEAILFHFTACYFWFCWHCSRSILSPILWRSDSATTT